MEKESHNPQQRDMVIQQIISRGIDDAKLLRVFEAVPRHLFVPKEQEKFAYGDFPLPIGEGQTISQPYMVALMTEALKAKEGMSVLEVGTGSGYQAAILAYLGLKVYSIERFSDLAEKANKVCSSLGYEINIRVGDGTLGWADNAPYDRIIVTAGSFDTPKPLIDQLKIGGVMVIPLGSRLHQTLTVVRKIAKDKIETEELCGCIFVPLVGKYGHKE